MASSRVLVLLLLRLCWFSVRAVGEATTAAAAATTAAAAAAGNAAPGTVAHGGAAANSTQAAPRSPKGLNVDSSMIQRALYVLIGITMTGVLYFLIRAVRLKRPVPRRKYGLLSNYDDSVEMVEGESDEDDTLYEARSLRR